MKDEKKAPKLRFKGFTDDWEQVKYGEIFQRRSKMGVSTPALPSVEYDDINPGMGTLNKEPKSKGTSKRGIHFNPGDVLFGKLRPYLKNWLFACFEGVAVGDFWVLTSSKIDHGFTYSLIQAPEFQYIANLSSGSKMPRSDWGLVSNARTFIPTNLSEQKSISSVLFGLDTAITLHEEKKCLLERLKSALSQEMFANKNGYPAVRFEWFDKAWKQSKLGEITKVIAAKPYISTPSTHGNYLVIQQGDKPIAGFSNSNPFKNYNNITLFGDHTLSLFKPRSPFLVASDGIKILSPSIEMNGLFYFYELEKYKPKSEGYKRHFTILKKCKANFPTDIDEQKLIGSLLLRIDNLITKQQLKMDKLNETKESLLQNMFI